ncbi:MAG: tryptophan synthase subunit alpha [Anaerolineae bacterium]|nr:tryptophan synthase subunit alpha [Anaerolineae bacterium]
MKLERNGRVSLGQAFGRARDEGRCALIAYLTAGYPDPERSPALFTALQAGGADVIEMGVPFSDPVADGPTIQAASQAALEAGMTPRRCLELVGQLRSQGVTLPIVLMGYYNPIFSYGLERYVADCAQMGADGLIVPDLPPEEAQPLQDACGQHQLALIFLVAPTTAEGRLVEIARMTQGFLYVVSRLGTTGASLAMDEELERRLALARVQAHTPVAVGFGVSRPEEAQALAPHADGVIVGSAIVRRATEGPESLAAYVRTLRAALTR